MSSNGSGPEQSAVQRSRLRMRVAIAVLAIGGALVFVLAAVIGFGDEDTGVATSAGPEVRSLIPEPGDEVLQQQHVGVELDARYRVESLVVYPSEQPGGGVDVSAQVAHIAGLNRFEFAPGEGRLIEALSPDTNCAVATYVLIARPEEADTVRWCFQVS